LTADIDIAEMIAELSSETGEAAHLYRVSASVLRSSASTHFEKASFFVIGKVFSGFAESSERDGADQGTPLPSFYPPPPSQFPFASNAAMRWRAAATPAVSARA